MTMTERSVSVTAVAFPLVVSIMPGTIAGAIAGIVAAVTRLHAYRTGF